MLIFSSSLKNLILFIIENIRTTIAEVTDKKKTKTRAFYNIEIDLGFDSSTVEVLISLNLLIRPLSYVPYPANEETEAKEQISSLSS